MNAEQTTTVEETQEMTHVILQINLWIDSYGNTYHKTKAVLYKPRTMEGEVIYESPYIEYGSTSQAQYEVYKLLGFSSSYHARQAGVLVHTLSKYTKKADMKYFTI